jgi:CRP-like cAMP-binding protein
MGRANAQPANPNPSSFEPALAARERRAAAPQPPPGMTHPLVRKLLNFGALSAAEIAAVTAACTSVRSIGALQDIDVEDGETGGVKLLLDGIGCRYKTLADGRRQIVAYFLPGDTSDLRMLAIRRSDYSFGTLSACRVATLTREAVAELTMGAGQLPRALDWMSLVEESIGREWIVNVGRRTALERMAHLFCELYYRMRAVGLAGNGQCELHVTQVTVGDALALSAVHVNRTLQELRRKNLATLLTGRLEIYDLPGLEGIGLFNSGYLYLPTS